MHRLGSHLAIRVTIAASIALPGAAAGQGAAEIEESWSSERVLALVGRARAARATLVQDGTLRSYRALTQGHIYFFVDPEVGQRALIRVDQVAVELRWQAPDLVQQHMLGERSETRLPVRDFRYYVDRLTLVQHGLGNEIRVGAGRDVAGVPHPFAPLDEEGPGGEPYEFRLADSLSLRLPGRPEPLTLYELDVRPVDPAAPGIIGSVTVDQRSAQIVRMAFTFTPASYVDPRTDRISVDLDYGLWEGLYWLPNLQRIEVRREIPELDIGVGTVIRAVLRTGDYQLNVALPDALASLEPVTAEPVAARRAYEFPVGLFDGLVRDGLSDVVVDADPRELRARAMELARGQPSSGLSPLRLHLPGFSSLIHFSRTEGLALGAGAAFRPGGSVTVRGHAGYRVEPEDPHGTLGVELAIGPETTTEIGASWKAFSDLGLTPGSDPLLSSLAALVRAEDYRDPFYASGVHLQLARTSSTERRFSFALGWERAENAKLLVRTAPLASGRSFRPVRAIAEGDFLRAGARVEEAVSWPGSGRGTVDAGLDVLAGGPGAGGAVALALEAIWGPPSGERELALRAREWSWLGDPIPQGHRLLGGRGTLPGYPFHRFAGQHAAAASLEASTDLGTPLLRLRGAVHSGWSGGADADVLSRWDAAETDGVRSAFSIGVGLFWDILLVEAARGWNGGEWQAILSIDPLWWDHL